jgi:23S rRNA pseudouridine1911/1915/1917 synthase
MVEAATDFTVIDESEDWIIVDKPAPLPVHPANGKIEPTLLGGLEHLLAYEVANGARLAILTRLDRETSGLVLVAKNLEATRYFSRQFQAKQVAKRYQAIVHGWPEWHQQVTHAPILRKGDVTESAVWLRQMAHPEGKPCSTAFQVRARFENAAGRFSLLDCEPETGRMHQIRVHLEALGHPLVGDKIYGTDGSPYLELFEKKQLSEKSRQALILDRHALHAVELGLDWRGQQMIWKCELARDLQDFLSLASPVDSPPV